MEPLRWSGFRLLPEAVAVTMVAAFLLLLHLWPSAELDATHAGGVLALVVLGGGAVAFNSLDL